MKRLMFTWIGCTALIMAAPATILAATPIHSLESTAPEYVNWTGSARQAALTRYNDAAIVDFLYVGCKATSWTTTEQIFKYWMKEPGREFAAYVTLAIDQESQRVLDTKVTESDGVDPAYGKFIRVAETALLKKYPSDRIHDYRPHTCKAVSEDIAIKTFRFWLRDHGIVDVTIVHEMQSEKVIRVETNHLWGQ